MKKLSIQAQLKWDDYLECGKKYFIVFNKQEQNEVITNIINNYLLEYGKNSLYAAENKDYMIPCNCIDDEGNATINIPEKMLYEIIKELIEIYNVMLKIGDNLIYEKFEYDQFLEINKYLNVPSTQVKLEKMQYNQTRQYLATFDYYTNTQKRIMKSLIEKVLLPIYGLGSVYYQTTENFIRIYVSDAIITRTIYENEEVLSGILIPEDILLAVVFKLVDVTKVTVKVGNGTLFNQFDYEELKNKIDKQPLVKRKFSI